MNASELHTIEVGDIIHFIELIDIKGNMEPVDYVVIVSENDTQSKIFYGDWAAGSEFCNQQFAVGGGFPYEVCNSFRFLFVRDCDLGV